MLIVLFLFLHFNILFVSLDKAGYPSAFYCTLNAHYRMIRIVYYRIVWRTNRKSYIEPRHFDDLERPQTQISSSGHSLTLNISKMATYTVIVTMEGE